MVETKAISFCGGPSADTEPRQAGKDAGDWANRIKHAKRTDRVMDTEINVLALVKGEERFIFLFDDTNRDGTLRQLAHFAADPEIDFSWYDAAMLSRKIRDAVPQ